MADGGYNLDTGNVVIFSVDSKKCYGKIIDGNKGILRLKILWSEIPFLIGGHVPIPDSMVEGNATPEEVATISVMQG